MKYVPPVISGTAFTCPNCGVYAKQDWTNIGVSTNAVVLYGAARRKEKAPSEHFAKAECDHCHEFSIWHKESMVFPETGYGEPPNADLPEDIQNDYREAARIASKSPRGAAALLRLAIQKLCKELGQPGNDINADIGALVRRGLRPQVQQALDIVRVTGNEAVHPGVMDLRDNLATVQSLFTLVNFIAHDLITAPKAIQSMYDALPEPKKKGIEARDSRGPTRPST